MLSLLEAMQKAQETPEKWEMFQHAVASMNTIENNQQAAQEGFEDETN